jgi:S1-C subfamily serine protease
VSGNLVRKFIIIASLLCISCTATPLPNNSQFPPEILYVEKTVEVLNAFGDVLEVFDAPNLSISEQRARSAAVKVRPILEAGHGSGTYMYAYGHRVVVTAAHVVRNSSTMAIDGRDGETVVGKVVFVDRENDIAFLVVPEIKTRTALRYWPQKHYNDRLVGTAITYTGFPSHHDLLTIRGYVASLEHQMVVTNMFGWFGASGSGAFDPQGRFIGVVSGIDMGHLGGHLGGYGMRIPLESIVWIAPASQIDHDMVKARILTAPLPEIIKAFPGAAAPRRGGLRD